MGFYFLKKKPRWFPHFSRGKRSEYCTFWRSCLIIHGLAASQMYTVVPGEADGTNRHDWLIEDEKTTCIYTVQNDKFGSFLIIPKPQFPVNRRLNVLFLCIHFSGSVSNFRFLHFSAQQPSIHVFILYMICPFLWFQVSLLPNFGPEHFNFKVWTSEYVNQ